MSTTPSLAQSKEQKSAPSENRVKPVYWLKVVIFNGLLAFLGLLFLELIFGAWFFRTPLDLLNIPRDIEVRFKVESPYFPKEDSVYIRDRWGLRGQYPDPSRIDILTIGGSTTDQRWLSEDQTWQDVLRRNLSRAGKMCSVVNAGVAGQSTFGNIRNFEVWFPNIPGLNSRYILVYTGNNDMFLETPNAHWDLMARTEKLSLSRQIKDKSATYLAFRTLRGMYLAEKHGLRDRLVDFEGGTWVNEPFRSDYSELLADRVQRYSMRLNTLIDHIENFGSEPIIVTQARGDYRFEEGQVVGLAGAKGRALRGFVDQALGDLDDSPFNGVDHYHILSLFNSASMEVCRRRGGICIELHTELLFEIGDFYDYVHNTPRGSSKIGDYLAGKILDDPRISLRKK